MNLTNFCNYRYKFELLVVLCLFLSICGCSHREKGLGLGQTSLSSSSNGSDRSNIEYVYAQGSPGGGNAASVVAYPVGTSVSEDYQRAPVGEGIDYTTLSGVWQ